MESSSIIDLLLDLLSYNSDRLDVIRLEQLARPQWDTLIETATVQRVRPLLYHRLKTRGLIDVVPKDILHALHDWYRQNSLKNLRYYGELRRIVAALNDDGIPAIALKGIFLAEIVYGNIALREMNDIDLLVPKNQVVATTATLSTLGYPPRTHDSAVIMHLPRFIKPNAAGVEVHWAITRPDRHYSIPVEVLWKRAVPVSIAGTMTNGLSAEDLLLHLCLHTSYQHQFTFGLRPFCDIAETIRHYGADLDWQELSQRAEEWQWKKGVYLSLLLANDFVDAGVPAAILRDLRPQDLTQTVITTAREQVFTDKTFAISVHPNLAKVLRDDKKKAGIMELLRNVFLPREVMANMHNLDPTSPKLYFFYISRIRHGIVSYAHVMWLLFRGDNETKQLAKRTNILGTWLTEG